MGTSLQLSEHVKNVLIWIGAGIFTLAIATMCFWSDSNTQLEPPPPKEDVQEDVQEKTPEQLKAELSYIWEQRQETPEEIIIRLTSEAGTNTKIALAIAKCESGLNPGARHRNRDGSIDRGLWQWNSSAHPEITNECAYDVECSTKEFIKYQQANHLTPWVCYSTGKYKKYLN